MNSDVRQTRGLTVVLNEVKEEAKQFIRTRVNLFKSEFQEKLPTLKTAAILLVGGGLLLGTAYFLLTLALVAAMAVVFKDSDYRWVFAFLSVGGLWILLGGIAVYFAKREFELKGIVPRRTIEILKGDKMWIEREARNQI
jgi:uncharacterized membrane protein YqjE